MINITVYRNDKKMTAFEMSGHANSGPYGSDLVCAAASAVSFGAVNAIHILCKVELDIKQKQDGGYLYVSLPDNMSNGSKKKAELLLESMLISLQTIEHEYSKFIKIKDK